MSRPLRKTEKFDDFRGTPSLILSSASSKAKVLVKPDRVTVVPRPRSGSGARISQGSCQAGRVPGRPAAASGVGPQDFAGKRQSRFRRFPFVLVEDDPGGENGLAAS